MRNKLHIGNKNIICQTCTTLLYTNYCHILQSLANPVLSILLSFKSPPNFPDHAFSCRDSGKQAAFDGFVVPLLLLILPHYFFSVHRIHKVCTIEEKHEARRHTGHTVCTMIYSFCMHFRLLLCVIISQCSSPPKNFVTFSPLSIALSASLSVRRII